MRFVCYLPTLCGCVGERAPTRWSCDSLSYNEFDDAGIEALATMLERPSCKLRVLRYVPVTQLAWLSFSLSTRCALCPVPFFITVLLAITTTKSAFDG